MDDKVVIIVNIPSVDTVYEELMKKFIDLKVLDE